MRQLFITSLLILMMAVFAPVKGVAQTKSLDIESFIPLTKDTDARIQAPVEDQNGDKCALIKVSANIRGLQFEAPALGVTKVEQRPGEIWVYIPAGSKSITILHNDFPPYRGYMYPVKIESSCVYEMKVKGYSEGEQNLSSNSQMLVMHVTPTHASLFVDNEEVPTEDGLFSAMMQKGSHTFRVEAPRYEPKSGEIELGDVQITRNVRLNEKFGYLHVESYPEKGANVYVNDKLVGQTPFDSEPLDPASYNVKVEKELYFPKDTSAIVRTGGEKTEIEFTMLSTIKPKEGRKTFVIADAAIGGGTQTAFGVMVGMAAVSGGYIQARTDFGSASTDLECDDTGALTDGSGTPFYKDGVSKKARLSFTAGYIHRLLLNNPFKHGGEGGLYAFAGAGYGQRTLAWETTDGVLAKNKDHSASGIAAEAGLIGRFGKVALSLNYQTVQFKYHEVGLGVGLFF